MNLDEYFNAKMGEKKKPFSMTDYEAIPPEMRQEYVKKTYTPYAKSPVKEAPIDVEGELKKKERVTPKLESIKAAIAPQPEQPAMPQAQPMQAAPQPAPELKQEDMQRQPSSSGFDIPQELLLGLIPLATEAIMGKGQGQSYDISSKYYTDVAADKLKRGRESEDKLAAIALKKASAKGANKTYEVDVDGKPIITREEEAIGKQAWKPVKDAKGMSFEEWAARKDYEAKLKQGLKSSELSEKEKQQRIDREMKLAKEWSSDEFTRGSRKVADSFKRIMTISPYSANPVEDMGLIFDLMKSLDPQSVVRESEQAMAIGARSYDDVANYFDSILSGKRKLTPTQVLNIKKFAGRLYERRMESQKMLDQGYISRAGKYNLDPSTIVQKMSSGVPVIWTNRKTGKVDVVIVPEEQAGSLPEGAQRLN